MHAQSNNKQITYNTRIIIGPSIRSMATIKTKILKSGEHVYYSLTEKQSESKFGFNMRLFLLVEDKYLGYIREKDINKKDIDGSVDVSKIKKKILIKDIRRILNIGKQITIMINQYDKNNKLTSLKWLFRMETEKLADSWVQLLEKQNSPFPSRKTTEQKERQNEVVANKNPSIKQFVKDAEVMVKHNEQLKRQQDDLEKEGKEKQRKKQLKNAETKKEQVKPNSIQPLKMERENQRDRHVQSPVERHPIQRQSDLTFSFKGQNSDDIEQASPPRKQQQIHAPHPMLQRIRKMESNLSSHLQDKVDKKQIERELVQYKKSKRQKTGQFRQLNENLTNRQKELQSANFYNYFRQPPGTIDDRRYQDFYYFCEMKTMESLVQNFEDEVAMNKWVKHISNNNGVEVKIIKTEIKQIPGNSNICDEGLLKRYLNRQKNANYIWKIIHLNEILSSIFYIPMSCIVEYQGVLVYFSCLFNSFDETNSTQRPRDFSKYFEDLADFSKISKTTLENSSYIKFTKISPMAFAISQINEYLPRIVSINCQIRPEMFARIAQNDQNNGYNIKMSRKQQEQQNKYFKGPIQDSLNLLSQSLDRLDEYVLHPSQFSQLLHTYGLNMVHMCEIYKRIDNSFIKGIIKTEAAIRSFKVIYRKQMQQMLLNIQQPSSKQQKKNEQGLQSITQSLLNILLSKREESQTLWNVVTLHSQINFKLAIEKEELNKGYLFLGLESQLNLKIKTIFTSCEKIFNANSFVNSISFVPKIKPCQIYWIDQEIYYLPPLQAAQSLTKSLNLLRQPLPFYIHQNKQTLQKIEQKLALCYAPNSPQIKYVPLYRDSETISQHTLLYYRKKIAEVKWQIRINEESNAQLQILEIQNKLDQLKGNLKFYFGLYHPFYTQFYDILISVCEKKGDFEKSEEYSKLSFANMLQLCSGNTMHLRLANNYYQKGDFYQNWGKIEESIANYKKAKNILQFNQFTNTKQFATIQIKLAQLYLNRQRDSEASKMLLSCFELFCDLIGVQTKKKPKNNKGLKQQTSVLVSEEDQLLIYQQITNSLQLLNRCSQSSFSGKNEVLIENCLTILQNCLEPQYPIQNIQLPDQLAIKMLKILIQNFFSSQNKHITKQFFLFAQQICDSLNVSGSKVADPAAALLQIKHLIINNALLETLNGFDGKAKEYLIETTKSMKVMKEKTNKKLDQFQYLIRSICILLGEPFILGILNDSHKQ